jgi:hypothetical protein
MFLDYSKIEFESSGRPEMPELQLQTLSRDIIGILGGVSDLRFNIKFSEPSEISFTIPKVLDDGDNPLYGAVTGHRIIYTKHYGIYVIMNPETEADGISDMKQVRGYSLEKTLDSKRFFLEEGTFNFWNPAAPQDTIIGRILELAPDWSVGYVSPTLIGRYRTFDSFDDYLLSFVYNTVPDKYRCVFVFDPYAMTISVYDADEARPTLPIYLDFDNLVQQIAVEEISDELVTALRPYGADELDIRNVNPIGSNWIYDLSYFIENGDISGSLAEKWQAWQRSILNNQALYKGLVALRASSTTRLLTEQAALIDLQGELEDLTNQQSITIQTLATETTSAGKKSQQQLLNEINAKIKAKKAEIAAKESTIDNINADLNADDPTSYSGRIKTITEELAFSSYFTKEEQSVLSQYLIEQDITESTFVATDVDTSVSGSTYSFNSGAINISGADILEVDFSTDFKKRMFTISGGTFAISGDMNISGDVIRGTLEVPNSGQAVMSLYAGSIAVNNKTAASGMITLTGTVSGLSTDVRKVTVDGITTYEGSKLQFNVASSSLYLTANVSEYQKYSVQMELFDYAVGVLSDLATPTYEFSVDSANFIFAQEFAPFRNSLELGKAVYLLMDNQKIITPIIIEFELSFEDRENFSIVFSNRFKRHDSVNTLKDMIETSYSTSRSFDANKYIYNQVTSQASSVSKFMQSSLDAAVNSIVAAANQSVLINGAGIHVGGNSNYQLRIIDSMIAMTDDNWSTAKLAVGLFATEDTGTYFGVNAEVIGGKLIVGNNLIIENENDYGVMQFKVDATGAWLNNATFILQSDSVARSAGGKIILDPRYGIVAGNGDLFDTEGTTVTPSFIDSNGNIELDDDGIPTNANFYLDIRDGSAYFRGTVNATSGEVGGWTLAEDYLHSGSGSTYVALNASGTNNAAYAIWAGASNPANAPFYVKRDGSLYAKTGTFKGTLDAAKLSGNLTADSNTGGWLIGCGIDVNSGAFYVDQSGNVTMRGGINLAGNITWSTSNSPCQALYSTVYLAAPSGSYSSHPTTGSSSWHRTLSSADKYASYTYDGGSTWTAAIQIRGEDGEDGRDGVDGSDATVNERNVFNVLTNGGTKFGIFNDSTSNKLYINASYIRSGIIDADLITLGSDWGGFCCAIGNDGTSDTYGSMMYGSDPDFYFIATNKGVRMQSEDHGLTVTNNGIFADEEITVSSDRRLKTGIAYQMNRYEEFFMRLKPTQFQYKAGASGRFHTGFIAQDVETALIESGLSTDEFAGLVITPVIEVNKKDGIEDCYHRLRYGEFISLNTYMIQKLYRRIEELEEKLNNTI